MPGKRAWDRALVRSGEQADGSVVVTRGSVTMTLPVLPALVFDVVWERLGLGPMPSPLGVRRHGRDDAEREERRARANRWLTSNGLGDAGTLDDDLRDAFRAMDDRGLSLSLRYSDSAGEVAIGCFPQLTGRALRVIVRDETVELGWLNAKRMAEGMLEALPDGRPGSGRPVRVGELAVVRSGRAWRRSGLLSAGKRSLIEHGVDPEGAEWFLRVLSRARAIGQASAERLGTAGKVLSCARPLSFVDSVDGRYVVLRSYGSVTLMPAGGASLAARIKGLAHDDFLESRPLRDRGAFSHLW
ncbi:ESX secretion-associated protein EspG [Amycolatopsis sp. QT-25]|uniref:ESX secretion-associated protein EspG n=1 Tax=Amycolatopsis sp. QT-25 TaxID=3034022 RepID=UPI0023EBE782|nr:ESX secretion-associated protein EspG [Amycolatopsis sp. QT-25]WET82437.1 ESX secretion-associated protein EspG [Amycolatopsis sp. QT-25]